MEDASFAEASLKKTWLEKATLNRARFKKADCRGASFKGAHLKYTQWAHAKRYLRHFARDVQSWDLLLSQNKHASEVQRRAFHYRGPILESGYPRNDLLFSPEADRVRADTRRALGLDEGVRAVLYAPTWRDSFTFDLELDLGAVADELGSGTVFLLRAHNHVAKTVVPQAHPRVWNVSGMRARRRGAAALRDGRAGRRARLAAPRGGSGEGGASRGDPLDAGNARVEARHVVLESPGSAASAARVVSGLRWPSATTAPRPATRSSTTATPRHGPWKRSSASRPAPRPVGRGTPWRSRGTRGV